MTAAPSSDAAKDSLAELGQQLAQEELRSSARLVIMLSLGVNHRLGFSALLSLTHCGKGSLNYHLKQLEGAGMVRVSTVFTFGGPRVVADITEKGRTQYRGLIEEIRRLPSIDSRSGGVPS